MELAGSAYLYALAQISIAFVAFSTIVIVVRLGMGAALSKSHLLLIRLYIELGFMATAFSMLPMLLATLGWSHTAVWRASQILSLIVSGWWILIYPKRHRASTSKPMPRFVHIEYVIGLLVGLYGWANAIGYPYEPYVGPYAVGVTWALVLAGLMFLLTMNVFLRSNATKDNQEPTKPNTRVP